MNVDTKRGVRVSQRISKLDFRMRKQLWISPRAMNKRQTKKQNSEQLTHEKICECNQ